MIPFAFFLHSCDIALYNPFIEDTYKPKTTPVPAMAAASPVMNPAGGTYDSDQSIDITCETAGAVIRYTTDGTEPNEDSPEFTIPIIVAGNGTTMTIKAFASKSGMSDSAVTTEYYTINDGQVSTPSMNPPGGTYESDQSVTIACSTQDATIRYTTNGDDPTALSPVYTEPVPVSNHNTDMIIKAFATKTGMLDSPIRTESYSIRYPVITGITSTTGDGIYGTGDEVNVTVAFSESVILSGGTLNITLDAGAVASVDPFGPEDTVSCTYTIASGESSARLDATGVELDGGLLTDTSGNPVYTGLPSVTIADGSDITVDGIAPVISAFTLTSGSPSTSHFITFSMDGTDGGSGITHWLVNETGTKPSPVDPGWVSEKPGTYRTSPGYGTKTIYAWAKDAASNVGEANANSHFGVVIEYTGASSWSFEENEPSEDLPTGAAIDYDDNIYIVGLKQNASSDWKIIKLLPDGSEDTSHWNKEIDWYGGSDCAQSAVTDSANNVYVCGYLTNGSDNIWGVKKFDSEGAECWTKEWNYGTGSDIAQGIAIDSEDNVYVAGFITNGSGNLDWWMKKYSPDGTDDTENWNFGFDGGYGSDTAVSVATDSSDNVYIAGTMTSSNGDVDWMVRKYGANGAFVWGFQYNRAANHKTDKAYTVTVDSAGGVYAAGYSTDSSDGIDWAVKKFNTLGDEDTTNWDKTVDNGTNDVVWGIGTDSNDNVYVGGRLLFSDNDWAVIKYDSAGTELWRDVITNTGSDWCRAIVVDSMNYAYGIGGMYRSGGGSDWYIKKYSP